jgi:hypothetical protein
LTAAFRIRLGTFRRLPVIGGFVLLTASILACELDEVTLAEPDDIPIAEAYIRVGDGQDQVTAFLHWTLGTRPARDLMDLTVRVTPEGGAPIPLFVEDLQACVLPGVVEFVEGVCYTLSFNPEGLFQPGDRVELEIFLEEEDDDVLRGATRIPYDIDFIHPRVRNQCALAPGETIQFMWNRSPGVWAYSAESEIKNLKEALALDGIEVETDSIPLVGFAISDADTTIAFPQEFGVFERLSLETEVAVALQEGLPLAADADVVVAALDQNYVNWVRGGNFNPSGPVRVSSLRGPGVGVFGSIVRRTIRVRGGPPSFYPGSLLPPCNSIPQP